MTFYMNHPYLDIKRSHFLMFWRFIDIETQSRISALAFSACWLHHMTDLEDKVFKKCSKFV